MEESASLFEMFLEGGWTMWVIVLLTLGALPATIAALVASHRGLAMVGLALVAAIGITGVGGTMLGRRQVDRAMTHLSPVDRALIHELGYREASRNLQFAGLAGVPLMLLAVAAYARSLQKSE